jgi:hypothetical protein
VTRQPDSNQAGGNINLARIVYTLTRDLPFVTVDIVINGSGAVIDGAAPYAQPAQISPCVISRFKTGEATFRRRNLCRPGAITIGHSLIAYNFARNTAAASVGGSLHDEQCRRIQ